MDKHTFNTLLDKYLRGKASVEEKKLLEAYYEHLLNDELAQNSETPDEELRVTMLANILTSVRGEKENTIDIPVRKFYVKRWIAAAAVVIFIAGTAYLFSGTKKTIPLAVKPTTIPAVHAIEPGTDKATLTLANGTSLILDSTGNGLVTRQGASNVTKKDGHLLYGATGNEVSDTAYNTVSTPKGGQYHITLADKTEVWLNASSSIRFPASFLGNTRKVEITGEVYFEVAKNTSKPFLVAVNDMTVEVLGTHFNIMAYPDEASVNTTLLEGAVKVSAGNATGLLHPGEQSMIDRNMHAINITKADTAKAVAWKNGLLLFKRDNIKTIMRQIGRWYDVDISYSGAIPARLYSGSISKYVNIAEVLRILELGGIKCKTTGNKITVLQ